MPRSTLHTSVYDTPWYQSILDFQSKDNEKDDNSRLLNHNYGAVDRSNSYSGDSSSYSETTRRRALSKRLDYEDYSEYPVAGYGSGSAWSRSSEPCCPLTVDPLSFLALVAGIAAATFFLNTVITMNIEARRRRKRSTDRDDPSFDSASLSGRFEDLFMSG